MLDVLDASKYVNKSAYLLGAWTANIWTEHQQVWGFTVHVLLFQGAVEHLQVTTTAIDALFVLHGELNH